MKRLLIICTAAALGASALLADDAYVQTDGSNYIATDYYPNPDMRIEVDFQLDDTANVAQPRIFASHATDANYLSSVFYVNSAKQFAFSVKDGDITGITKTTDNVAIAADTVRHTFIVDSPAGEACLVTGATTNRYTLSQTRTKRGLIPLYLFMQTTWDTGTKAKAKLYSFKISEKRNGEYVPVRDYSPAVQDGIPGIKDAVTGVFHSSIASAQLATGGDIPAIESGEAYLQSTGAAYIDTGYYPTLKTAIEVDYSVVEKGSATQPRIFGAGATGLRYMHYINGSTCFAFGCYDSQASDNTGKTGYNHSTAITMDPGVRHRFFVDGAGGTASFATGAITNRSYTLTTTRESEITDTSLLVFSGRDWAQYSKIKLYSLKIYEDGELARSYVPYVKDNVPGIYDQKTGAFHAYLGGTFGGAIGYENCDAYLESDGTQAIVSDYFAKPGSKIVADFSFNEVSTKQQRPFGADSDSASNPLSCSIYLQGGGYFGYAFCNGTGNWTALTGTGKPVAGVRYVVTLDGGAGKVSVKGGDIDYATDMGTTRTATSSTPLGIFSDYENGAFVRAKARIRLYSLKCYENGALVREWLPYKSGTVAGLYETQTGEVFTNTVAGASAFGIGGAGADGAGAALLVAPADAKTRARKPAVLKAFAPGAVSYRWFEDGVEIPGESGASLSVAWRENTRAVTYGVVPVFSVYGSTVEGDMATATVDHTVRGMVMSFK